MKELMTKTKAELEHELKGAREALRVFRFEMAGSKIKNVKSGKNLRVRIAQILTVINAK